MKIYIGADHAGFDLKEDIIAWLIEKEYEVVDKGAFGPDEDDDFVDFVRPVAEAVSEDPEHRKGIVLGGSGQGEAIVCNRYKGIYAGVYYGGSEEIVKLTREHNDANILSLGARFLTSQEAIRAIEIWLSTEFSNKERYARRIQAIDE